MSKNILVVTYWSFKDALIQTYTLPYVKIIASISKQKVYIVCLEQKQIGTTKDERIQINKVLETENIVVLFFDYNPFGVKQTLMWGAYLNKLMYLIFKNKIKYIHTWCTPGGAIGYLLSILTGRELILDSFEPHAELMIETGTWSSTGMAFRLLFKLEELQTKRATKIIAVVSKMNEYSLKKYNYHIAGNNFYVKPACVDFSKFYARKKNDQLVHDLKLNNKIIGIYAGKLGGIYLDNELFDFIKQCYVHWGENFAMIMLTNTPAQLVQSQLKRIDVPLNCVIQKFVYHEHIPDYMALGDFAINFMKPVPSRRFSTPIKNGEYWAMGLPIIITSGISDDSDIIENQNVGYVLKALSDVEYREAIRKIDELLSGDVDDLKHKIESLAHKYRNFDIAKNVYNQIYNTSNSE
jgi:glycosyltransferase involved in cell wall biosynthesis